MDDRPTQLLDTLVLGAARTTLALLVAVTLLPLLRSGEWWVRIWDFPRLQITGLLIVPLILAMVQARRTGFSPEHAVLLTGALAVAVWQAAHVVPQTPLWRVEVPASGPDDAAALKLLTANVKYENDRYEDVLAMIRREDPDLLLVIEVDDAWADALAVLDERYPYRTGVVRGEGLGLVLWSRFDLKEAEVKHLVSDRRPSVFATIDVPGIGPTRFIGVHPTPPGLRDRTSDDGRGDEGRHDSRTRDAELVLVAREVEHDPDQRWLIAGDFNDVAWSHTTRLFKDLSGLKDPRPGRGLFNTYHADHPIWRFPIDHIFVSEGWRLGSMNRVELPGSDHFAITVSLAVAPEENVSPEVSAEDRQEAEEIVEEGKEDAAERDSAAAS